MTIHIKYDKLVLTNMKGAANMEEKRFDQYYEDFLNSHACDVGHDAIFELTKDAFAAGWRAAGGDPDQAPPIKKSLRELRAEGRPGKSEE